MNLNVVEQTQSQPSGGGNMNKDKIKGTMNEAVGRAKSNIGHLTGDRKLQAQGTAQQMKGKVEKAIGTVKDASKTSSARNAMSAPHKSHS
jgi:uncharacterized protein YjbJ (UPF0337 family)